MGNCCKAIWNLNSPYLSSEGASNLKRYVYKSSDKSITYKCCMSPFANCLLKTCVPLSLAPNVITLISFACVVLPTFLLLGLYGASLRGPVPQWYCFLQGLLFFVYCARRTGNSSPLGLLFDHACDCLVTVFVGVSLARIYYLGNSPYLIVPFIIGSYPFFHATLEEYYVGSLNLPIINGPNEGCLIIIALYLIPGIIPNSTFDRDAFVGMNVGQFASVILALSQLFPMSINFAMIAKHSRGRRCVEMLPQLFVINLLFGTLIFLCTSTSFIHDDTAIVGLFTFGFAFAKLTLQLAHVSDTKFSPLKYLTVHIVILIFLCLGVAECLSNRRYLRPVAVWPIFGFIFLVWFHMTCHVIHECCEALHIRAFCINQRQESEPCSDEPSDHYQLFYPDVQKREDQPPARLSRLESPLLTHTQPIVIEVADEEPQPRPSQTHVKNLQLSDEGVEAPPPPTDKSPFEDTRSQGSNYQTFSN